jgi:superfamily II DNA/RNA helicase
VPEHARRHRAAASSSSSRSFGTRPRRGGPRHGGSGSGAPRQSQGQDTRRPRLSALEIALEAAQQAPAPADLTFAELGLPAPLVAALAERGMERPFAIQSRTLPDALAGRDVLGRAQTGSGKTLGFGLPLLARLADSVSQRAQWTPRAVVLVPTRELARQVAEVLAPLGRSIGVRLTTVYGGAPMGKQIDALRRGVDLVVATPGRLIDLMERGAVRLGQVQVTVLDEADHMADLGFMPAVTQILDATPADGQRLLFSATLDRGVDKLVTRYLNDPAVHAVASAAAPVELADHQSFVTTHVDKLPVAAEIAGRPARTLFFVRTKHGADRLAEQLTKTGAPAAAIHGNLNQNQRQRALAGFAAGHPRVLVATDVAARGIHIDDVDLVVHYDPPADAKDYLHRSGRTARAGATGTVISLVEPQQVRIVEQMHRQAGVRPTSHRVTTGHPAVTEVATSGEPVPEAPPVRERRPESRGEGHGSRRPRGEGRGATASGRRQYGRQHGDGGSRHSSTGGSARRGGREGAFQRGAESRGNAQRAQSPS